MFSKHKNLWVFNIQLLSGTNLQIIQLCCVSADTRVLHWHWLHFWIMGMVFWCVATAGFICLSCQNIPQLIYEWQATNDRIIYGLFMQHPLTWSDNTFFVCRTLALPLTWTAIFNLHLAQNINTFLTVTAFNFKLLVSTKLPIKPMFIVIVCQL